MKALIISDLHLTDVKTEEYRWNIFDWTANKLKELNCTTLLILGDIFDKKDRHPSTIVNKLTSVLVNLSQFANIYILKGNHDYIKPDSPFLEFLSHLPNITWIPTPTYIPLGKFNTLWLPHTRNPMEEWTPLLTELQAIDLAFMHQSVIGCKVSNYAELNSGMDLGWLIQYMHCPIISGDIHVPQTIKTLQYVGTQHPVAFGDTYQCRALLLELNETIQIKSIPVPGITRHSLSISSIKELNELYSENKLKTGDHAKVSIVLIESQLSNWTTLRDEVIQWCDRHQIQLFDIKLKRIDLTKSSNTNKEQQGFNAMNATELLQRFFIQESVDPKIAELGKQLLLEVLNEKSATH